MPDETYGFTAEIERAAVRQMLGDPIALSKMGRHVRPEGFADPNARVIVKAVLELYRAGGEVPTPTQVFQELFDAVNAGKIVAARVEGADEWLRAHEGASVSTAYVVDKVLSRERARALMAAIEDAGEMHLKGELDDILPVVERADQVGKVAVSGTGVDFRGGLEARTRHRLKYQAPPRYGTGIAELDDLMEGGLSSENPLGLVMGGLKSGKSLFLDAVAVHSMAAGHNVAYFTLENGENQVCLRHDAAVSGVRMSDVWREAEEVQDRVEDWMANAYGSIWVRKMPAFVSVKDTLAELDRQRIENSWEPNVVIWDYTKLMRANDPKLYERRSEELGAITLEMRAALEARGCVGWSAAQVKNSALEKETPVAGDIGYSTEIMENIDVGVAICRTLEERTDGMVRFFITASRFSPDAVQTQPLESNYPVGRIVGRIVGLPEVTG